MDNKYEKQVHSIKDYIINESKNSIESFRFEQISPLKYLSKNEQLNKLNVIINKFYEILNTGYPFVAYNFLNNVFNEENFFSNIPICLMDNEGIINIENLESNEEINEFRIEYVRAKYLELALIQKDLIQNSDTEPLNISTSKKDELPIKKNIEIVKGIFQSDVRRNIRTHIQIQHEIGFESFLEANYLADETYYIDLIYKQNEVIIAEYEKIVNFQDISGGDEITDDIADQWYNESITRDHYWYYKEYQMFLKERLTELEKIKTIENSKKSNFDITKEVDDFEVFSNNFETEITTLFNQNIPKNEKLNTYYKDYFPKYLTRVNNIVSHIEQMENDFKLKFPELHTDLQNLNTITSKFKKSILNDLETALNTVLKIDYERLLFEYLNITNKLETDLKIEGKKISKLFEIFYNRMLHIKSNPKPQQSEAETDTSTIGKTIFKNKFDNVTENKVFEYFTKNLVEKGYLTKETLTEYLKQAFELKTPPIQKFSFENLPTQAKIRKVFYDYFSTTAGKPNGRKLEYVKLLGEYFNGFDTAKINTNFSK